MSFAWPAALLALAVIPVAIAVYLLVQQRRSRYAVRFTNLDLLANVVEKTPAWRRHVPAALYLLALAALLVALARPEFTRAIPKEQATVILVTDVSGSMNATDVEPTRLAAAQDSAKALVDELPKGFRISLISFSNGPRILVSPTTEKESVDQAIDGLTPRGGTAMGDAILEALYVASTPVGDAQASPTPAPASGDAAADDEPVIIILLSDGANTIGSDPIEAARQSADMGIPIFTVALGTQDGVAIVTDNLGRERPVRVPPDEETLQEIADMTEARFFSAPSAGELDSIYDELGSKIGYDHEQTEVTVLFAAAAAAFVAAAGALSLFWFNRFP